MTYFNKGPAYGLSAEVKSKIAQKYDLQKEEELRFWIEEVTGMSIGENFQKGLKDGVILCELINKLQPGLVKKINHSQLNWHKLENLGNFIKAILTYGLKPSDIFEANDLFENGNMTQVQTTLLALASMAKTKGIDTKIDIGVKYADKQTRHFDEEKIKAGQCVIGLQMGTNKCASQAGMTAYGTRRHLYDPKTQTDKPHDQTTISLQMGTNKGASQAGMAAPGTRRDIFDQKVALAASGQLHHLPPDGHQQGGVPEGHERLRPGQTSVRPQVLRPAHRARRSHQWEPGDRHQRL
ncbi:Calponin-3 [Oryzias melastigma]|uniref:Calponin n=1 Tax=Oryzias melastigma TaxID=30732 RepID=A0A834CNE9_ORYME|nr:Calponin-3 [Oryzias melastigma]